MTTPAYFRAWRKAHPAYAARQNVLRNARRRLLGRDRGGEAVRRHSRALPPLPALPGLHTGHRLFDRARQIVGPRRTSLVTLYDPLHDDLLSVATLALVEGRDPAAAVARYRTREGVWGRVTAPLWPEVLGELVA